MLKIALLFDRKNDWLRKHIPPVFFENLKYSVEIFYEPDQIKYFDMVFVLGFTRLIGPSINKYNSKIFVIHESDLPVGRGFAPMQWQILEGTNTIKVSLIELAELVDTGDVFHQTEIHLDGSGLYEEIRTAQARASLELISCCVDEFPKLSGKKQKGKPTYFKRRVPSDSEIDIDKTVREQFQNLRISNNEEWPAFFYMHGSKYILKIYREDC